MTRKIKQSKEKQNASQAKSARPMDFSDRLAGFEMWLVRNWRLLAGAAAVIVIALIVYLIVVLTARSRENSAVEALAAARGDDTKLAEAVANYASAQAVNDARFALAAQAVRDKKYDEAVGYLDAVVGSTGDAGLSGEAQLLAATVQEQANKLEDAAHRFAAVGADASRVSSQRAMANYQAGRIYAALGRLDEARASLQSASALQGVYSDMAKAMLYNLPNGNPPTAEQK